MLSTNTPEIFRITPKNGPALAYCKGSGVTLLEKDGLYFKDLSRTGTLLPYEDWRLSAWERAKDLASRLSLKEIAGLMLYSPHQAVPPSPYGPFGGTYAGKSFSEATVPAFALSDQQKQFLTEEHIRHVLLFSVKDADTSARWSNALQALAEALPFGIPVNLSSDPRNGAKAGGAEFKTTGQDVSKWPEGVGFAACFDPEVVSQFAKDASREYRALGITTALGPQIDLCTDPRWMRYIDTLGENVKASTEMVKAYCDGMQTTKGTENGWGRHSVNTMVKHWPGGGSGEGGRDAHYSFGQFNVYPGNNFAEHLKPFTEGAFKLNGPTGCASAVMPYYSVSWGQDPNQTVGNAYSTYLIKDLLRGTYDYQGVVCTDWGITGDPTPGMEGFGSRCYGVQHLTEAERHLLAIMNGVDQFGGNSDIAPILEAYQLGIQQYGEKIMRQRFELSAARLLKNIFQCGLFEDPYLDPAESEKIVGCEEFVAHGYAAQQKSVVLLKNKTCLPLKKGIKVYIPQRYIGPGKNFFRNDVPARHEDPMPAHIINPYAIRVDTPLEADVALVFVESPKCNPYSVEDLAAGGNGYLPITLQYHPYTAAAARRHSIAGGDPRETNPDRSYYGKTNTTQNEQDLDNILNCRKAMGNKPVIVCATLDNPMVMAEFESSVDAIVVDFGVSRAAVLDILFGDYSPTGKLPMQLPRDMETVELQCEDKAMDMIPYTDSEGNTYDYGFGLTY